MVDFENPQMPNFAAGLLFTQGRQLIPQHTANVWLLTGILIMCTYVIWYMQKNPPTFEMPLSSKIPVAYSAGCKLSALKQYTNAPGPKLPSGCTPDDFRDYQFAYSPTDAPVHPGCPGSNLAILYDWQVSGYRGTNPGIPTTCDVSDYKNYISTRVYYGNLYGNKNPPDLVDPVIQQLITSNGKIRTS